MACQICKQHNCNGSHSNTERMKVVGDFIGNMASAVTAAADRAERARIIDALELIALSQYKTAFAPTTHELSSKAAEIASHIRRNATPSPLSSEQYLEAIKAAFDSTKR